MVLPIQQYSHGGVQSNHHPGSPLGQPAPVVREWAVSRALGVMPFGKTTVNATMARLQAQAPLEPIGKQPLLQPCQSETRYKTMPLDQIQPPWPLIDSDPVQRPGLAFSHPVATPIVPFSMVADRLFVVKQLEFRGEEAWLTYRRRWKTSNKGVNTLTLIVSSIFSNLFKAGCEVILTAPGWSDSNSVDQASPGCQDLRYYGH